MKGEEKADYYKEQSRIAAEMVVDALMSAGIIKDEDGDRASEIAEEEILVRWSIANAKLDYQSKNNT